MRKFVSILLILLALLPTTVLALDTQSLDNQVKTQAFLTYGGRYTIQQKYQAAIFVGSKTACDNVEDARVYWAYMLSLSETAFKKVWSMTYDEASIVITCVPQSQTRPCQRNFYCRNFKSFQIGAQYMGREYYGVYLDVTECRRIVNNLAKLSTANIRKLSPQYRNLYWSGKLSGYLR